MAEVKIDIPVPDLTSEVLGKAVMAALGEAGEAAITQAAVRFLVTPETSGYRAGSSPLMQIFQRAIVEIAEKLVMDRLTGDAAFLAQVEQVYLDAVKKAITDDRETLVKRLTEKLHDAFAGRY